jgi:hypothetical protein
MLHLLAFVRRPAHGIYFLENSYVLYGDRCLELSGIKYQDIEVNIDQGYKHVRLSGMVKYKSGAARRAIFFIPILAKHLSLAILTAGSFGFASG